MSIKEIDIRLQISMICSFLLVCFMLAMISFGLFVEGEEITAPRNHWEKLISQTGLWQRLSLGMMYVPYIVLRLYKK